MIEEEKCMNNMMVSIHCATYNHEKYIADAIEGFLKQKTNFKYEILIHDDASTDRTADIIREYEKRYPDLIKPIYQTVNQYSRGQSISKLNLARAQGKYIALCEGDDYWIDPNKLQKQVDYMEAHPECSLCVHGGYIENASDKNNRYKHRSSKKSKCFSVVEVIEGGGGLFLTNSMLYPLKYQENRPEFFKLAPVGDYPLAINLSLLGKVFYIDEPMSVYRVGVSSSWTNRSTSNVEKRVEHFRQIAEMLDEVNNYTNGHYQEAINRTKYENQLSVLLEQRKIREVKFLKNNVYYKTIGYKKKFIFFLKQYFPSLIPLLKMTKRRYSKWILR